jgi:hypothetical protein
MTVYEKYQLLARDASASGDRIAGENYLQHAEHYYRLMEAAKQNAQQQSNGQDRQPDQRQRRNQSEQSPVDNANTAAGADGEPAPNNGEAGPVADASVKPLEEGAQTVAAENAEQPHLSEDVPMGPAALAAEVEAQSEQNSGDEAAPKRTPRRRRRPPQDAAPETVTPNAGTPEAEPQEAATQEAATQEAEPQEADPQEESDSDDSEAVNA